MKSLLFSSKILIWYDKNKRELPWRGVFDPYKIWLSEVILQQTRIEQGTSYYHRFIERYPTIHDLANASEDEILKLWQGLGYYSRARNLHYGAKQIVNQWQGKFPQNAINLITIKGIGEYTAAAIASIVFNEAIAAVDGNAYRVLSRYFNISTPIDTTLGKKQFKILANELINAKRPGDYNQAVMEFGALTCKPKNPECQICPLNENCQAYLYNSILHLPVKSKKQQIRNRFIYYIVLEHNRSLYFNKRTQKDIWKNLYDFPSIELTKNISIDELALSAQWTNFFNSEKITILDYSKEYIQLLSHQRIQARFIHISVKNEKKLPTNFIKIDKKNTFELAVPKIIENYLLENNFI